MSKRTDITDKPPRLAYSCRCGWLDLGHMDPTSHRANEGAQDLWRQVSQGTGKKSKKDPAGFKVAYQQMQGKKVIGLMVRDGVAREYWVKSGLNGPQQQAVALAIFMEVSYGFESMQANWFYKHVTDSGFSAEDLVSDLIGFYRVLYPTVDVAKVCGVVSPKASLEVWDAYGAVGKWKNKTFQPLFFPCSECECKSAGVCRPGEHRYGGYHVSVATDGRIVVKPGDWLSKYSAAMYLGDTTRVREFGRLRGTRMEAITDVNRITPGEAIYHMPTYEFSRNPRRAANQPIPWTAPLPSEFRQVTAAGKGPLFRDWTQEDELTREEIMERRLPARWK